MTAIWRREVQSYFTTTTGYVYIGIFLLISSILFQLQILQTRSSDLLTFLGQMSYLWMLLSPVLTMRLMAEEKQKQTDRLLLSSPVSLTGIVVGKYLAALTVMLLTVLLTFVYVGIVGAYGAVYPGEILTGYLGFILQGKAFAAIDLLMSSLASGQVTAVLYAFGANFILWMLDMLSLSVPATVGRVLDFISLYSRNEPFLMGQLSFASIIFDLAVTVLALALTVYGLDRARRRGLR
ncbi:MAG: ABC transporter permease subunit [Oscillospiraceae bacterium]|nr:ABC transporter permease subunit [Oscillospiraceae bacterium]